MENLEKYRTFEAPVKIGAHNLLVPVFVPVSLFENFDKVARMFEYWKISESKVSY